MEKGNNEFESGSTGLRKIMNNEKICVSDLQCRRDKGEPGYEQKLGGGGAPSLLKFDNRKKLVYFEMRMRQLKTCKTARFACNI